MSVRTNVLIHGSTLGAGSSVFYECPAGIRTIVKYVTIRFQGADLMSVDVRNVDLSQRQLINRLGAGNNTSQEINTYLVLVSGERLILVNRGANAMSVFASGSELAL